MVSLLRFPLTYDFSGEEDKDFWVLLSTIDQDSVGRDFSFSASK